MKLKAKHQGGKRKIKWPVWANYLSDEKPKIQKKKKRKNVHQHRRMRY